MTLSNDIKHRMYLILALASMLPFLIAGQLIRIHIQEREPLQQQGEQQASTVVSIPSLRGSIYDRKGRELVVNTASYHLALDPTVEEFNEYERNRFFDNLSLLTGKPVSYFEDKVRNRFSPKYVLLLKGLDESDKQLIDSWEIPGSLLVRTYTRRYNYGKTASHVVGYVDKDGKGIDGLELQYQNYLEGKPGYRAVQRDRNGEIKAYVAGHTEEPVDGQDLILTLDLELQAIMESELLAGVTATQSEWGTAIAMAPSTGEILGMANVPSYDPNQFYAYKSESRRNRAITDRLEPGSTFKLVTATAAIESDLITVNDSLETGNGFAVIGGRGMHDLHGYGTITFKEAIAKSSNLGIAKTATRMDPGLFYQYARNLGFGQKTWIDLPGEVEGTLKKPREWSGTSLASMSIGYEVDVTPLQMITAYAAFANGGLLLKPYVVAERRTKQGTSTWTASRDSIRRAIKPETAHTLLPSFVEVVESGSAKLAKIDGMSIAGKTGTARVIVNGSYDTNLHRASFVGFFPAENPQLAILILLARPGVKGNSGAITTPIFKKIASRWISTNPEELLPSGSPRKEQAEKERAFVADLKGRPATVAASQLRAAGYEVEPLEGLAAFKPVLQHAFKEKNSAKEAEIELTLETDSTSLAEMPDFTGLSARQAVHWARAIGINDVRIKGTGMVINQSPKPGEPLPSSALLNCK